MTSNFHSEEEHEFWNRVADYEHDGVEIHVTCFYGYDHAGATTVFTARDGAEVFHADKHCHRLHSSDTAMFKGQPMRAVTAHTLEQVMTQWGNPVRPCDYCTQDIHKTAEIVQEYDKVPEACLHYFEPEGKRVSTRIHRSPDGEVTVSESSSEVY